jgi:hypothetical protein
LALLIYDLTAEEHGRCFWKRSTKISLWSIKYHYGQCVRQQQLLSNITTASVYVSNNFYQVSLRPVCTSATTSIKYHYGQCVRQQQLRSNITTASVYVGNNFNVERHVLFSGSIQLMIVDGSLPYFQLLL